MDFILICVGVVSVRRTIHRHSIEHFSSARDSCAKNYIILFWNFNYSEFDRKFLIHCLFTVNKWNEVLEGNSDLNKNKIHESEEEVNGILGREGRPF